MANPTKRPTDCERVVRALWDYLDREMDEVDMATIDAHLAECQDCRAHAVFERQLINEIRGLRAQHNEPHTLRQRVLGALRRAQSAIPER